MEAVAIIPARGGSKRLVGKNVRPLGGVPLVAHSIWQAKHTPCLGRCVVTTDDDAIATVAREWGAEVILRPAELASDTAKTGPVLQHALEELKKSGTDPEAVVLLQPTNPLRPVAMIEQAVRRFQELSVDSLITVTRSHHKLGRIADGLFQPDYLPGTRSQDLESRYYENGLVYVTRAGLIAEQGDVFGRRIAALETNAVYGAADIDTLEDFEVVEFLYERYKHHFNVPEKSS